MFRRKLDGDDLYRADQAVKKFCIAHPNQLTDREHRKLERLLEKRAAAISDVLGVKVHAVHR